MYGEVLSMWPVALSSLDSAFVFFHNLSRFDHGLKRICGRLAVVSAIGVLWNLPSAEAQGTPGFANKACVTYSDWEAFGILLLGGSAQLNSTGTSLVLTDGGLYEAGYAYCYNLIGSGYDPGPDLASFATAFTFQLTDPLADGFTFLIQPQPAVPYGEPFPPVGWPGGWLGYHDIPNSVAIKFDLYNNEGEGPNSTGVYVDGANPGQPSIDLTGTGIDLHSGDPIQALITYVQPSLNLNLTDTVTHATWSHVFTVDIPATVGTPNEMFGFTGGTGGLGATQEILSLNIAPIYYPSGFTPEAGPFALTNASFEPNLTSPDKRAISLTQGYADTAASVFSGWVEVQAFTTDFTFQISDAVGGKYVPPLEGGQADGFAFVIQNRGNTYAVGGLGGGLGYVGIPDSVAIKFDLYDNKGEGSNSTGIYEDGAYPGQPSIDLTGTGIDLHSPDIFDAHITYDGTTLILTLTDTVTQATWSHEFPIDIPTVIGAAYGFPNDLRYAHVGFTGGTGGETSTIQILSWTYWGPSCCD